MMLVYVGLTALLLWIPQNAVHESSHALAIRWAGGHVHSIYLLPSMKLGHFSFAHIRYDLPDDVTDGERAIVSGAPQVVNTLVLVSALIYLASGGPVFAVLCGLYLVNFVDGAVSLSSFYLGMRDSDVWRWAFYLRLQPASCVAIALSWQVMFGLGLLWMLMSLVMG